MRNFFRKNKSHQVVNMGDESVTPNVIEAVFSSDGATEGTVGEKKVLWKDILSEGQIKIAPVRGMKKPMPFKVVAEGSSDPANLIISMTDILQSNRDKAFKYVKLPVGHPKDEQAILNNSGFSEDLRIVEKNGRKVLQAALAFTEPDVAGKVRRGTIPDVSSGLLLNYTRKSDGRTFPVALHHVALTGDPVDPNLDEFKRIYASDDDVNMSVDEIVVATANFADEENDSSNDSDKAEVIWNEQQGSQFYRQALNQALNPEPSQLEQESINIAPRAFYEVIDIARGADVALVNEFYKGESKRWVIPFTESDGKITPAPAIRWTEGKEALIAASDDSAFGKQSFSKVKEEIKEALKATFGEDGEKYTVQEASLANQALISDPQGNVFLADYMVVSTGKVFLSDSTLWEKKADAPSKPKEKANVVSLFDENTPEGRVQKARMERRKRWNTN